MTAIPYLPHGRRLVYVGREHRYAEAARAMAVQSGCVKQRTGAVIVKRGKIVGRGNNTVSRIPTVCPRQSMGTGVGYEFCKQYCQQGAHAEIAALTDAGTDVSGADLYLVGHHWVCRDCWRALEAAGIREVFIVI